MTLNRCRELCYGLQRELRQTGFRGTLARTALFLRGERRYRKPAISYATWIEQNEPTVEQLAEQQTYLFVNEPLIDLWLLPTESGNCSLSTGLHTRSIKSVLDQTYGCWQLHILGDETNAIGTLRDDDRVHYHPACDTLPPLYTVVNQTIDASRADFVGFLRPGAALAPFALFEIAKAINLFPTVDLFYSDCDMLHGDGKQRHTPWFKPNWSPELLYSVDYLRDWCVIRKTVYTQLRGLELGEGLYALFLRAQQAQVPIQHIPQILIHRQSHSTLTRADCTVLCDHLVALGRQDVTVLLDVNDHVNVRWNISSSHTISIIIPSRGASEILQTCIRSILAQTVDMNYEIIIINNGPRRPSEFSFYTEVQKNDHIRVMHWAEPYNYSAVNNFGAQCANGDLLLFLNNDTKIIQSDWLKAMAMWFEDPTIGAVGPKLLFPSKKLQHAGVIIGMGGLAGHAFYQYPDPTFNYFGSSQWYRNYNAVTGACVMMPRDVFEQSNGFDERFVLNGSDIDLCMRIRRAGYRIVYTPFVALYHLESATSQRENPIADFELMRATLSDIIEVGDLYYNSHLSLRGDGIQLRRKDDISASELAHMILADQRKKDRP